MCTSGFLLVSHIGLVCPGAKVHGGSVRNSNGLWDETKVNARHCLEVRALLTLILTLTLALTLALTLTLTLALALALTLTLPQETSGPGHIHQVLQAPVI